MTVPVTNTDALGAEAIAGTAATISVIVPSYHAADKIEAVLAPLIAMRTRGEVGEVLVIDDGSTDGTPDIARAIGVQVEVMARNGGPGAARNRGAAVAKGDILWFVDSDVVVHADGARHIHDAFEDPTIGAVFGSYDATPSAPGWFSRYKNLSHRFYHQTGNSEASTFWAGCGAVRARAFNDAGGFDAVRFPRPSIEDIELGYRLRSAGWRIRCLPDLLGKHLKRWTVGSALRTDIFSRAVPWSRLILENGGLHDDLNINRSERHRAALAGTLILSLLLLPILPWIWPLSLGLAVLAVAANHRLFSFMRAHGGTGLALGALAWHQFYYLYASGTFAICTLLHRLQPVRNGDRR